MVRRFNGMMHATMSLTPVVVVVAVAGHECRWFQQQQRWLVLFLLALVLGQHRTVVCSAMTTTTTTVMESENDREDSPLMKHAVPIMDDELLVESASASASALEPNEDATAVHTDTEQDPKSADMNNVEERCRWGERCHTNSNTQPSLLPLQNKSDPNNDHEQYDPNNNDHDHDHASNHVPPGIHGGGATITASTTITTTTAGETNSGALPFVPPVKSSLGSNNNNNKAKKQATHPDTASVREYSTSSLEDSASSASAPSTGSSTGTGHAHIHVNHSNHHPHGPPEGFTLTAKIYTDPEDGHSYFALPESNEEDFIIPYLECGAVGSTSWPIPVRSGAFRHFPVGAKPSLWSNDSGNDVSSLADKPHSTLSPQLIVVLHNAIEITVSGNSEERRIFEPGSVILSLDTVGRGHKLRAATHSTDDPTKQQQQQQQHMGDLNVLILTLPHHYHPPPSSSRRSVDLHLSLFGLFRKDGGAGKLKWGSKTKATIESPCLDVDGSTHNEEEKPYYSTTNANANANAIHHHHSSCNDGMKFLNREGVSPVPTLRRILFGILGGGLGGLFSYWISQIAPQILAVVVGGGGVIYMFVWLTIMGGEWSVDQWQVMGEERRFSKQATNEESPPTSNPPTKMEA